LPGFSHVWPEYRDMTERSDGKPSDAAHSHLHAHADGITHRHAHGHTDHDHRHEHDENEPHDHGEGDGVPPARDESAEEDQSR
jgi:hypothetical protein